MRRRMIKRSANSESFDAVAGGSRAFVEEEVVMRRLQKVSYEAAASGWRCRWKRIEWWLGH
jgi:hypothetical protein